MLKLLIRQKIKIKKTLKSQSYLWVIQHLQAIHLKYPPPLLIGSLTLSIHIFHCFDFKNNIHRNHTKVPV